MKINRSFHKIIAASVLAALAFASAVSAPSAFARGVEDSDSAPFDVDSWEDGFPLLEAKDGRNLRAIWAELETREAGGAALSPFADAVYLQLKTQGKLYKGKPLRVRGRLLRAVRTPDSGAEDAQTREGFYDLWILLPDAKRDPIRVLTKRAPDGFGVDAKLENETPYARDVKYRTETVETVAVYYRASAYDAGDEIYAAPTLVALDFRLVGPAAKQGAPEEADSRRSDSRSAFGWTFRAALCLALVLAWLLVRRAVKSRAVPKRRDVKLESLPDKLDKFPILLAALALAAGPAARADDAFWAAATDSSPEAWARAAAEERAELVGESRAIALEALARLAGLLSASVLKEQAGPEFQKTTLGEYAAAPADKRVDFFRPDGGEEIGFFVGTLDKLDPIPLNEQEKERAGVSEIYRAQITTDAGAPITVYAGAVPSFRAPAAFSSEDRALSRRVAGVGIRFGQERAEPNAEPNAALLSPRLEWIPIETPLGAAGLDLSSYEDAPVYPIDALEKEKSPERRKEFARALRWTRDDRRPFYGTLAAVKRMPPGADPREPLRDVVPLFNRPEENQGRLASFSGWARRVNLVLVEDPDVRAATGLDRYYQIFLYTNDSQGWPLTLCAPELPDGMTAGGGREYRRNVDVSGYFYKTWAYRKSGKDAGETDHIDAKEWTRAPLLIGRITKAYPEEEEEERAPVAPGTVFTVFAALACAWIILRRWSQRKNAPEESRFPRRR